MATWQFHEVADLFPLMSDADIETLVEDIRINGLQETIWLYENKILDGRNRYNACKILGIEPSVQEYTGQDPLGFVISMNLHRKHLTYDQRVGLAANLPSLPPSNLWRKF